MTFHNRIVRATAFCFFVFMIIITSGGITAMFGQGNREGDTDETKWDDIPVYEIIEGNGNTFTVMDEEVFGLLIRTRPGTGFSWNIRDDYDKGVIRFLGLTEHETETGDPLKFSGSVFDKFVFRACRKGESKVRFHYSRPWEKDKVPEKEITVVIRVRNDRE